MPESGPPVLVQRGGTALVRDTVSDPPPASVFVCVTGDALTWRKSNLPRMADPGDEFLKVLAERGVHDQHIRPAANCDMNKVASRVVIGRRVKPMADDGVAAIPIAAAMWPSACALATAPVPIAPPAPAPISSESLRGSSRPSIGNRHCSGSSWYRQRKGTTNFHGARRDGLRPSGSISPLWPPGIAVIRDLRLSNCAPVRSRMDRKRFHFERLPRFRNHPCY